MGAVLKGPAGHWYALFTDPQFGETLIALPIPADLDAGPYLPPYPETPEALTYGGWYEVESPAPEVDDDAIRYALRLADVPDDGAVAIWTTSSTDEEPDVGGIVLDVNVYRVTIENPQRRTIETIETRTITTLEVEVP